ncbi:MAG: DNA recombination protein RmuC [Candidatus Taylorbacteria bacterium]|nr:DNA recombination protein RmuC [Candidatus Taylorbacteria bacterium]
MNEIWFLILGFLVLVALAANAYLWRRLSRGRPADETGLKLILEQVNNLSRTLDVKISEANRMVHDSVRHQFGESAKLIKEVTAGLVKLDETNKQVVSFADQLQSLQEILKNPKQRGVLGEYYLETLLKNVLPPGSFKMQYAFSDGTVVDAVVFVKDKIIPIDSKFSLENYNRLTAERDANERERLERLFRQDLKNRIDETAKYVKPEEGTMEFAFMFIPHEAIYYDLLVSEVGAVKVSTRDLIEYAFKDRHVIIVSPTSFLAYLQTVLQGLKALQIEESAKEIRNRVEDLGRHLKQYDQYMLSLGKSLGTSVSHFNRASKEFRLIDKDVLRIAGSAPGLEQLTVDKPGDSEGSDGD